MDPCLHQWPKMKTQEPDTKDIPKGRVAGTLRVKCSSLFQSCCAAVLGQLCGCHLVLLVGNVMGVVLMSVDEGSVPQLVLLCPPVCTPWHPGVRRSQPVGGHIAKGRDTAQRGGACRGQGCGGGL